MTTQLKQGEVLERIVRRDRMGISELSRKLNVSRRTIYNWFSQDRINHEVIWQIGTLLGQDLSASFPDVFPKQDLGQRTASSLEQNTKSNNGDSNSVYFWMNKYIHLLEKYNELLSPEDQQLQSESIIKNLPLRNKSNDTFAYHQ
ncbi:helix-turn-helix domain containing protein [Pedobacter mucosus]|uniref:helix-turn-helix domain containing protein n=1 Tax=Pedobacter mucosus TaxID=2895286 RepID=UPI001EE44C18|nr:helix-turn-helix domain containing protein [Pedobacter mucosus]UKT62842.1 helix-turn-helix domain containing protein [Pedobacter mucosus]